MVAFESTTTRLAREELGACALIQDLLPLYIEGEVSTSSHDLIVEHLARCERCAGFLAGAQSVRGQLRRETVQRTMTTATNAPIQQAVTRGQMIVAFAATTTACVLGSMSTVLLAQGITSSFGLIIGGLPIFFFSLFLLAIIAKARAALSVERVLVLSVGCLVGAFASLLAFVASSPLASLLGFVSGAGAFIVIWLAVWNVSVVSKFRVVSGRFGAETAVRE